MPIEDSASAVLGPDPRLNFAPTSSVAFGTRGGIPSHTFGAMDRRYMKRAEEILTFKERVATLKEQEAARVQGSMAMAQISKLDPSQPDYLQRRNDIITRFPKAVLDRTANSFLDLQEDLYSEQRRQRELEDQRAWSHQAELDRMDAYAQREEDRATLQLARERARDVRTMSSSAQAVYFDAIDSGEDVESAFSRATRINERERTENEYLRRGGSLQDLYVTDDSGAVRPRTDRELAAMEGETVRKKREEEVRTQRISDLDSQNRLVQDEIKRLNDELNSEDLLNMGTKEREEAQQKIRERIASLQSRADTYREQLANLRGLQSDSQGADSSSSSAGGGGTTPGSGPTSSITGEPLNPASLVPPPTAP